MCPCRKSQPLSLVAILARESGQKRDLPSAGELWNSPECCVNALSSLLRLKHRHTEANPVESHQQGQEPEALLYEERLKDGLKPSSEKAGEMGDRTLDIGVFS